jgi:hypothetical protein
MMSHRNNPRPDLAEKICELFGDGQPHTLDEIVEGMAPYISDEEAMAAFDEGVREGERFGRRWARNGAVGEERDRLLRLHEICGGDWFAWLEATPDGAPSDRFFGGLHPERRGDQQPASDWWQKALAVRDWEERLNIGDELLVVGFAQGAVRVWTKRRSQKGRSRK